MKKILVIGSSHIGAIKKGLDLQLAPGSLHFDFIALPGKNYYSLEVLDGKFHAPEKSVEFICNLFSFRDLPVLDHYDYFLFCAARSRLAFDLYSGSREPPVLSEAIVDAVIRNVNDHLYRQVANCSRPSKLVFIGAPLLSDSAHQPGRLPRIPLIRTERDDLNVSRLERLIRKCCDKSLRDVEGPSFLLPPPHMLRRHGFCTSDAYIRGGIRVDGRAREKGNDDDYEADMGHGNEDYGVEIAKLLIGFFSSVP
jgi:hypothetical protein